MDIEKFLNDSLGVINGQKAWDWVAKISQYNRIQASNGYHDSLETVKEELMKMGYNDIEHFKSPADGKTTNWGYDAPYQWEIESGEMWITEPEKVKLCDFNDIPTSIITHSKSCDVLAEVVDIGTGDKQEDYEKYNINGKIILMSSLTYAYHAYIENSGALGVIYYPDLKRTRDNFDRRIYNSFFTTEKRMQKAKFGFSISFNQAMHLKELLKKGSVKIHAKIVSEFLNGNLEVLTTNIKGKDYPEQEIIIISHLCHPRPSANDNASGAAGLLELARVLKYSIDKNILEIPKRTIRFVWVPEFNGTVPWMKYHEIEMKNVLACINLDMIGEHPLKIGYPMIVNLTPRSTPSILNDISAYFIANIADHPKGIAINGTKIPMSYRIKSFDGGSDHILFIDAYFGIPSLMFGHEDTHYHSSMDTVEYCDSTELKRVISMAMTISYILAIQDKDITEQLWPYLHQGILNRFGTLIKILEEISLIIKSSNNQSNGESSELFLLGKELFNTYLDYELESLEWIKKVDISPSTVSLIELTKDEIKQFVEIQRIKWSNQIKGVVIDNYSVTARFRETYQANFEGPLLVDYLFNLYKIPLFKEFIEKMKYEYLGPLNELINLICKGNDILRVASSLSLDYKEIITPNKILELVNYLEDEKLIKRI